MSDPELTPPQEDQVRSLLASARHDEPVPADVAQRLDRVLEQLGAGDDPAPVVDLTARRHRRRQASQVILAAAAVVAVGAGVSHLGGHGGGGGSGSSAADSSAGRTSQSQASSPGQDLKGTGGSGGSSDRASAGPLVAVQADTAPVRLRADRFGRDVRVAVASAAPAEAAPSSPAISTAIPGWSCPPAEYGAGTLIPVVYQGAPSVLAVRSDQDGKLVVDVLACGTAEVLRSATVPAH